MLSSFFCMRLNTAGTVIGWVGSAFSLLGVVLISLGLANINDLADWMMKQMNDSSVTADGVRKVLLVVLSVYLVLLSVNLISSFLLVLGTVRERHLLLVPWLLNSGLSLFFTAAYYLSILGLQLSNGEKFGVILLSVITNGLGVAFQFYVWYAIYSLFKQLQMQREHQQLLPRTTVGSAAYPSYSKI